jgi:hypothetical protein
MMRAALYQTNTLTLIIFIVLTITPPMGFLSEEENISFKNNYIIHDLFLIIISIFGNTLLYISS